MNQFVGYRPFPRLPLFAAGGLVVFALLLVSIGRLTGAGVYRAPAPAASISRDLRFEDRADGSVAVFDASNNTEVTVLSAGANGFIRGVLRSFARERRADDAAITTATAGPPFRLQLGEDSALSIEDRATGRVVELNAFGETNSGAFAKLLTEKGSAP
ncbi:photosynthetic complex assembly protein PuhC [Methylocella silvestris]|uniref:Photosynthetic complex assembly protein n=1 Tax=Methylocella silvestris TaxID=199596 RepID=A0A2J7TDC9_METSI|nr:photosynthetic complex assembly protein PuhC [Methylocella silvestris]PNG24776.1 hypothetical protein CR492_16870 [Methylocella silvestris]